MQESFTIRIGLAAMAGPALSTWVAVQARRRTLVPSREGCLLRDGSERQRQVEERHEQRPSLLAPARAFPRHHRGRGPDLREAPLEDPGSDEVRLLEPSAQLHLFARG
jgi:hypothetical protein